MHFGALQRHHHVSVLLAVLRGPVLVALPLRERNKAQVPADERASERAPGTWPPLYIRDRTYSAFLHQVGDHDDDLSVLLPNHPPEVLKRGLEGALGGDISSGLVVTLGGGGGMAGKRRIKKLRKAAAAAARPRQPLVKTYIHIVGIDVIRMLGVFPRQSS